MYPAMLAITLKVSQEKVPNIFGEKLNPKTVIIEIVVARKNKPNANVFDLYRCDIFFIDLLIY